MKHSVKITLLLLSMFFIAQLIGIAVISSYSPESKEVQGLNGTVNITTYNLPYGMDPPQGVTPQGTLFSIIFAMIIAVVLMFVLMKYKVELFLRLWFFFVVSIAIAITINAGIKGFLDYNTLLAIAFAIPLAFYKVFQRNIIVHNLTELLIYPGIAAIFVPLLTIWTVVALLIIISIYDIYAVWHAGFMQKMAKYQITQLKFFAGFFVPYVGGNQREMLRRLSKKDLKKKKIKVSVAILGGGDVVFPIILAGVVFNTMGLYAALIISLGATLALAGLFYLSKKGKFYPAMPFISTGCLMALALAYLL